MTLASADHTPATARTPRSWRQYPTSRHPPAGTSEIVILAKPIRDQQSDQPSRQRTVALRRPSCPPAATRTQDREGDHHHDTQRGPRATTLDRCRFLAQHTQRRQSIAKQVPNAAAVTGEQDREEHREAHDQRGGERAPRAHLAIVPQPARHQPPACSFGHDGQGVDVDLLACGIDDTMQSVTCEGTVDWYVA